MTALSAGSTSTTSRAPAQRRDQPQAKTPAATSDIFEMRCDIQRSTRYHRAREAFYERAATCLTFLSMLGASAAVVTLLSQWPTLALWAAALVAVVQLLDLVFQLASKARLHNSLASEFMSLERVMTRAEVIDKRLLADLRADILSIEVREPPIKRYLDLICHNQVAVALGSRDIAPLTWWQRRFAHWLSGATALQKP